MPQRLLLHVARFEGEKTAGEDVADVGDEDEAFGLVHAARRARAGVDAERQLRRPVLHHVPPVVHRLGGADGELHALAGVVEEPEQFLDLLRGDEIGGLRPPRGH